jgi:hypothetical protein
MVGLVPIGVMTCTATMPAPTGAVAEMVVLETTLKLDDALGPKSTSLAEVKPEPVMVTAVPPPEVTVLGERLVIDGAT